MVGAQCCVCWNRLCECGGGRDDAIVAAGGFGLVGMSLQCGLSFPDDLGTVSMTADVPTRLEAGETFTITVKEVGVALGDSEEPPPADKATLLTLGAEPVVVELGSVAEPVQWPQEITLTVTGQPGEHVLFGVTEAERLDGTPPDDQVLSCGTGTSEKHGLFATIPIDEPEP